MRAGNGKQGIKLEWPYNNNFNIINDHTYFLSVALTLVPSCFSNSSTTSLRPLLQAITSGVCYIIIINIIII